MPYIICEKHGGAAAAMACSHLAEQIHDGVQVNVPAIVQAEYLGQIGWSVRLCPGCARQLGYSQEITTLHGDEGLEQTFGIEDQVPVCWLCFRAVCPAAFDSN
jgi:hypothetical protein